MGGENEEDGRGWEMEQRGGGRETRRQGRDGGRKGGQRERERVLGPQTAERGVRDREDGREEDNERQNYVQKLASRPRR